jgi:hypothetical protein
MKRNGRIIVGVTAGFACLAALLVARNWYDNKYGWPGRIQIELFGKQIVDPSALIYHDGFSHFGQGRFLWRYRVTSETPELMKLCHNQPLEKCSFSKDRVIKEGITLYGDYSQGVLTLDEDWS